MRSTSLLAAVCAGLAVGLPAQPAGAISDGVPDTEHPNVGALLLEVEPGVFDVSCSGVLLSPRHFLTSAHCLEGIAAGDFSVTFDQDATAPVTTYGVSGYALQPGYDVGVATLASPVAGIAPVALPAVGLLDDEAAQGGLRGHSFVNVGYGWVPNDRGRPEGTPPGLRLVSTSPFAGLTQDDLLLLMRTDATGEGGSCYVDSGSPKLYEPVPGARSNLAVAITSGGDKWCRAINSNQRLDLPAVRTFLDDAINGGQS